MNLSFQPTQPGEALDGTESGGNGTQTVDSRSWILKSRDGWKGFDPDTQTYFTKNIFFGGDLEWETNFNCLVISDNQSHSIN